MADQNNSDNLINDNSKKMTRAAKLPKAEKLTDWLFKSFFVFGAAYSSIYGILGMVLIVGVAVWALVECKRKAKHGTVLTIVALVISVIFFVAGIGSGLWFDMGINISLGVGLVVAVTSGFMMGGPIWLITGLISYLIADAKRAGNTDKNNSVNSGIQGSSGVVPNTPQSASAINSDSGTFIRPVSASERAKEDEIRLRNEQIAREQKSVLEELDKDALNRITKKAKSFAAQNEPIGNNAYTVKGQLMLYGFALKAVPELDELNEYPGPVALLASGKLTNKDDEILVTSAIIEAVQEILGRIDFEMLSNCVWNNLSEDELYSAWKAFGVYAGMADDSERFVQIQSVIIDAVYAQEG